MVFLITEALRHAQQAEVNQKVCKKNNNKKHLLYLWLL